MRAAVTQAGGDLTSVIAVREPLDLAGIGRDASGTHFSQLEGSAALVHRFGEIIGKELVSGGPQVDRGLLSRVRGSLLSAFDGQLARLEGLVVVRAEPEGMTPAQSEAAAAFESGLLSGVAAAGIPVVGVELVGTAALPGHVVQGQGAWRAWTIWMRSPDEASLDYALAGSHGSYGVKPTAQSLLPTLTQGSAAP